MSVVDDLHHVMEWLATEVCPLVKLKAAPDIGEPDTEQYEYEQVHPAVFGMYWPTGKAQCPPDIKSPHPGILVQIKEGAEDDKSMTRKLSIRLHLSAWNPGEHGPDLWIPKEKPGPLEFPYVQGQPGTFDEGKLGWMDAWNFLDTVLREVRNAESIGGLARDRTEPVTFGPYSEQGAILDLYPYWFCWVDFSIQSTAVPPVWAAEYL